MLLSKIFGQLNSSLFILNWCVITLTNQLLISSISVLDNTSPKHVSIYKTNTLAQAFFNSPIPYNMKNKMGFPWKLLTNLYILWQSFIVKSIVKICMTFTRWNYQDKYIKNVIVLKIMRIRKMKWFERSQLINLNELW